ncbi:hypothetical protein [Tsukamurella paurometabola]|uniref:Uncharacterized protein n=1 Tax=Tsukamurella paurometabola TaxID=2061 RepID=A0A3P8K073_TSUPA|nr:hypothetical protein [Tsukamurella paurometabola]MBS4103838.1 hypothetical protein [Tsukamurella paurometabola]UEA81450.1 hypothetical protein LK411_13640 [Tsukamurella paurometabola]VDR38444.1 Uncharacterised protein [Tsukamurella paurometabola]
MHDIHACARNTGRSIELQTLGKQIVNGRRVTATRPLEFVTALAAGRGRASLSSLEEGLFGGQAGKSAVANLAYRARTLGIRIEFDRYAEHYVLGSSVTVDALEAIRALRRGDPIAAAWLYDGPFLRASASQFSHEIRGALAHEVNSRLGDLAGIERDFYVRRFGDLLFTRDSARTSAIL